MSDLPIRRVTIAEQARMAAQRFMDTGEDQPNPHEGTDYAEAWRSAYNRYTFAISAGVEIEGSA